MNRFLREKAIERYLNRYLTYKSKIRLCEQELSYQMPTLTSRYGHSDRYIPNNTEKVAIGRASSRTVKRLEDELRRYKKIVTVIETALSLLDEKEIEFVRCRYIESLKMSEIKAKLNVSENDRSRVLDKLSASFGSLLK